THADAVEKVTVFKQGFLGGIGLPAIKMSPDYIGYRNIEMLCEFKVAFVSAGHGHDSACSITRENVFGNPDRDSPPVKWIEHIRSGKTSGDFFFREAFAFTAAFHIGDISIHSLLLA